MSTFSARASAASVPKGFSIAIRLPEGRPTLASARTVSEKSALGRGEVDDGGTVQSLQDAGERADVGHVAALMGQRVT